MPHFFIILLKINLVLILFSATYHLVLRRLTFYSINRIFLLFGIVFSSAYPFINLTEFFAAQNAVPAFVPQFNQQVSQLAQQSAVSIFWQGLTLLFYVGVVLMAMKLLVQFISLYRMHKNSSPDHLDDYKVRILNDEVSPFSFWQTIYINPHLHKKQDLGNILEHERVHVEEWHTLDIILAEICVVFYWFNPGVWLMKKAVRENIEFITDAKILKKGIDKKAYQYSLLEVGTLQPSVAIVNNFNLSDLKKRIKMMNAKSSSKVNLTRYLFVLPVLLCITLAFTIDKKEVRKSLAPLTKMMNDVLPDKIAQVNVQPKTILKAKAKKRILIDTLKLPDTTTRMTFIFKSIVDGADSSRKSIEETLKGLGKQVKIMSFKTDGDFKGKTFVQHFNFADTINPDHKMVDIKIVAKKDADFESLPMPRRNGVAMFYLLKSTAKISDVKDRNQHVTGNGTIVNETTTYFLNGNKISKEELDKLNVNKISDLKVDRNNQAIQISMKP
ncbi:beta-lactamase regulating signal transducer with metallopeptidase domain [Pedobacter sp. W3I1]|uniref:M56 family metallopeptidase n=1 Tax=Pedobacter sp. W3I1 TaxID=3042291 RepID=UPI002787C097|nr:M56 family metallopeptidase [Pedobacter sp. W3I1]MDQ0638861.1 beta-lactamase regulating signal transducer with metallopeptidase domain [Pedobacter sp. W3I1]